MSNDKDEFERIDLDAMLAKREEVVGSRDSFPFVVNGKEWWCKDPKLATDDWREDLAELGEAPEDWDEEQDGRWSADPTELTEHFLGKDQADEFYAAGGQSAQLNQALEIYQERENRRRGGDPTRPSSRATRRRQKRR